MSLPPCFASPDQRDGAMALLLVDKGGFAAWKGRQGATVQAWLDANGFTGQPGAPLLVPGADGRATYALAGIADARRPVGVVQARPHGIPAVVLGLRMGRLEPALDVRRRTPALDRPRVRDAGFTLERHAA
jgi:hypothetical protein